MARILIIDDDDQVRTLLRRILEGEGYEIDEARNGSQGIALFEQSQPDLIVTDIFMPDKEGLETIIELRREHPAIRILAISGGSRDVDQDFLPVARRLGADRTLAKPIERAQLLSTVRLLLDATDEELAG